MVPSTAYTAAREATAIIDNSGRGRLAVSGRDRASFLQGLLTNDVVGLAHGTGCYAAYLTPQGRMIADLRVLELGDRILLDVVDHHIKDSLLTRLDNSIFTEDVTLSDLTESMAQFGVYGPGSAATIAKVMGSRASLDAFVEFASVSLEHAGASIVVARSGDLGANGFDLYAPRDRRAGVWTELAEAGAQPMDRETAEVLRIEAGRPLFGVDMDQDTIPLEAGLEDRAISFTKGCYVGQEVIVRIMHRGHGRVARKLVGLVLQGEMPPVRLAKAAIVSGEKEVGTVTSAAESPTMGRPIALGYVSRDLTEVGTRVDVVVGEQRIPALVASLPFVS